MCLTGTTWGYIRPYWYNRHATAVLAILVLHGATWALLALHEPTSTTWGHMCLLVLHGAWQSRQLPQVGNKSILYFKHACLGVHIRAKCRQDQEPSIADNCLGTRRYNTAASACKATLMHYARQEFTQEQNPDNCPGGPTWQTIAPGHELTCMILQLLLHKNMLTWIS